VRDAETCAFCASERADQDLIRALEALAQANKEEWGKEYARANALEARVKELAYGQDALRVIANEERTRADNFQACAEKAEADLDRADGERTALRDFIYKECDGNHENVAWILKRAAGRESGGAGRAVRREMSPTPGQQPSAAKPAARLDGQEECPECGGLLAGGHSAFCGSKDGCGT